jgi:hypothetical protein
MYEIVIYPCDVGSTVTMKGTGTLNRSNIHDVTEVPGMISLRDLKGAI